MTPPLHEHMNQQSESIVDWTAHPARQRPEQAVLALGLVAVFSIAVLLSAQSVLWACFAAALLLVALNRFFLPSRFVLDAEGITARYPLRTASRRWADLRRFHVDEYGGYLSTHAQPSRLDAYRGIHLLFDEQRETIVREIARRLPEEARQ